MGDLSSIPGSRRSPGEGNGNPLQYSCLGNPMDRGFWQATVHGVARVRHDLANKPPPPQVLSSYLAHGRCSESVCWLNTWFQSYKKLSHELTQFPSRLVFGNPNTLSILSFSWSPDKRRRWQLPCITHKVLMRKRVILHLLNLYKMEYTPERIFCHVLLGL